MVHAEEVDPAGINDSVPGPGRTTLERRGMRWMFVKGRLRPGVTADQAHANVQLIGRQLESAHPETNRTRRMSAVPTAKVRLLVPQAGGILNMGAAGVMAVVGLVLLIACANVAGMLLARASARRREISVRLAIGASRARLVRQLVVEGAVLGTLGAFAALACAWVVVRALLAVELPLPVKVGVDLGIDWLSVYAFSTENWRRPVEEVRYLMGFNKGILERHAEDMHSRNVRITFAGRRDWRVPKGVLKRMEWAEELTAANTGMTLTICFNYGGRAEIVDAVRALVAEGVKPEKIDEKAIAKHLYDPKMPDPDLMVRTSGEHRISNFLLWELAYSELIFTDVLWPDFRREHLFEAVREYQRRDRRFGGVDTDD